MILNDATLLSKNIDGVECSTMREFVSKLVKAKDLSMKVYVNLKLVCAGPACLNIDNNWIIASTNALVSYTNAVTTDSIIVKIMQGDVELFESVTPCNVIIPAKDTVATFYVCLTSSTPYNELSKRVPHSVFRSRPITKLTSVDFDKITASLNPSGSVIVDDGDPEVDQPSETLSARVTIKRHVGDESDISSFLWYCDPEGGYTQINWGTALECVTGNTSMIRVGLLDPNKEIYTSDDGGVSVGRRYVDDEDIDSSMWDGASIVYEISFTPNNDTTITIGTKLPDDMP